MGNRNISHHALGFFFEIAVDDEGNTNISDGSILINLLLQALENLRLKHACRIACHLSFCLFAFCR